MKLLGFPNKHFKIMAGAGGGGSGDTWLFLDKFDEDLASSQISGSYPNIGGYRVLYGTGSQYISITGQELFISTGSGANYGHPGVIYNNPITRSVGVVILTKFKRLHLGGFGMLGLTPSFSGGVTPSSALTLSATFFRQRVNGGFVDGTVRVHSADSYYNLAFILRANGTFVFIKGGTEYPNWTLMSVDKGTSSATMYPCAYGYSTSYVVDNYRVSSRKYIPAPSMSDSFARANANSLGTSDGLGHPEANGGSNISWQGSYFKIDSNRAICDPPLPNFEGAQNRIMESWTGSANSYPNYWTTTTPTGTVTRETVIVHSGTYSARYDCIQIQSGIQQTFNGTVNGIGIMSGTWFRLDAWIYLITGTANFNSNNAFDGLNTNSPIMTELGVWRKHSVVSRAATGLPSRIIAIRGQSLPTSFYTDEISYQIYSGSSSMMPTQFIAGYQESVSNVCAEVKAIIPALNGIYVNAPCGILLNVDSFTNPQNLIMASIYRYGTALSNINIVVDKLVNGLWTNLITSTALNYVAGGVLKLQKYGTAVDVRYEDSFVSSQVTVSDASIINNTKHAIFSTDPNIYLNDFVVYPSGENGEYSQLDRFAMS